MLRLGSIGAGGRGMISKISHRPDQNSQLVAICDQRSEVLDHYRQTVSPTLRGYADYRRMLDSEKLDGVFITTPDYLHEEMAVAALERGLAVYLEKPLAITIEGCDRILLTASRNNAKLYVGHNMRFFPVVKEMKRIIESGRIGEVQAIWCRHFVSYGGDAYFKDWHSERRYSTGLLLQKGAHDIDVIHHLAGAFTSRTTAMGRLSVYNRMGKRRALSDTGDAKFGDTWPPERQSGLSPVIDVEDHSMVLMQLANGAQASYQQCHYTPDAYRSYTVIGTAGRIENFGDYSSDDQKAVIRVWDHRTNAYSPDANEQIVVSAERDGGHGGADTVIVEDFLNYIRTGKRLGATPLAARQAVAVGCLATESLRSGNQAFDVPALPPEVASWTD